MRRKYVKKLSEDERTEITDVATARQKTFDRAVKLLTFKQRSVKELRERLLEKEWTNETIVQSVIKKLEEYGYLNDKQFAKDYAASKLRQKPLGKVALKQKLITKKLAKEDIDSALEKAFEEMPESELIDRAIAKRLRLKGKPETRDDAKKFFDHLMRQGFSYDLVRDKIREVAKTEED